MVGGHIALISRLEMHDQPALINGTGAAPAADRRHEAVHVGIFLDDGGGFLLMPDHGVITGSFGGLGGGVELALVFAGDKPFGYNPAEYHRTNQDEGTEYQRKPATIHHPMQSIPGVGPFPGPFDDSVQPPVGFIGLMGFEPAAAEHGGEGQ